MCRNSQFKLKSVQIIRHKLKVIQRISVEMRKCDIEMTCTKKRMNESKTEARKIFSTKGQETIYMRKS